MSKFSECGLINRILFNAQQVCYVFDFTNNPENFIRSLIFDNKPKMSFKNSSERSTLEVPAKGTLS